MLQTHWERYSLEDNVRAETQLTANYSETYPVGLAVNRTAQQAIPLGKLRYGLTYEGGVILENQECYDNFTATRFIHVIYISFEFLISILHFM